MGLRKFGIKEETIYGAPAEGKPAYYIRANKLSAGPGSEPVTLTNGGRGIHAYRAGYMNPQASVESTMDNESIGSFFYALLGNYGFTENKSITLKNNSATTTGTMNIHEFFGGENTKLPSFTGSMTMDFAEKRLFGLLCESLKIEAKDDLATLSTEWVYKTEDSTVINENSQEYPEKENTVPLIGYDFELQFGSNVPSSVISEFSLEIKNNLNTDGTRGLGSRMPQKRASAQAREVDLSLTTTMSLSNYELLVAAEYGQTPSTTTPAVGKKYTPSACKLSTTPLTIIIRTCEDNYAKFIQIHFPKCIITCDPIETSESDEMELEVTLIPATTGTVDLETNGNAQYTDMQVVIGNNEDAYGQTNIAAPAGG